jgi:hypothetical protein
MAGVVVGDAAVVVIAGVVALIVAPGIVIALIVAPGVVALIIARAAAAGATEQDD